MKYDTGRAFRQALETRLQGIQHSQNIPLVRLRKQVAFERFMARLQTTQPDTWILKGGLAMQLRLGVQSRTTKDIDLLNRELTGNIFDSLVETASIDIGDWFTFEVGQTSDAPEDEFGSHRFQVVCRLDGRVFEKFHVDVGLGDLMVGDYDCLRFDPILEFAGIASAEIPCYPIPQQIAEKLHALTREYASGSSTRGKDLVDILLLASLGSIDGVLLSRSVDSTFAVRTTHPVPQKMPSLSNTLRGEYVRLARELGLAFEDFDAAEEALADFANPIFRSNDPGMWNADNWSWDSNRSNSNLTEHG